MSFRIDSAVLYPYTIPLKTPFRISAGEIHEKNGLLLELKSQGVSGWGEASVDKVPFYAHETVGSAIDLIKNTLIPLFDGKTFNHPDECAELVSHYRGGNFAKAALDAAIWDIYGKMLGRPVWELLGGTRKIVEVGPSIGIKSTVELLVDTVRAKLADGDGRIKLKVSPNFDLRYLEGVRNAFPDIRLMVDANNAYSENDFEHLVLFDKFNLMMMEQPLDEGDIYYHSLLRKRIFTPICLDESIHTYHDAKVCAALGSADNINIKVCRVGGLSNARKIHDFCMGKSIPNWIGSRVGSGVAEAARLAMASLENCSLPSDCVISMMYMSDDVLCEGFEMSNYRVKVKESPGLGIDVSPDKLRMYSDDKIRIL